MRKLMALAIGLIITGTTPAWSFLGMGDVSFDGSLEVSGNAANNETDLGNDPAGATTTTDRRGRTATRVRLGANAQVTEGVKGRVEFIRDHRQYGDSNGPTSITTEEGLWKVHNAFVDIEDLWGHNFRLGRQFVGNAGDLVWNIAPTDDDNLTNNSIDGVLVQCKKLSFINFDLFTGKSTEDDTITGATTDTDRGDVAGDVNLTSLDALMPNLLPGGRINVGFLLGDHNGVQNHSDDARLRTLRVGVNGGISENFITYRAEVFQNMGEYQGAGLTSAGAATKLKFEGNAVDLGLGLNTKEGNIGSFGIWANLLMASGDDNVIDDKDESFHDFSALGVNTSDRLLGEIFGKSNVLGGGTPLGQGIHTGDVTGVAADSATQGQGMQVINIGAHYKPGFSKKSTARVDFYTFGRSEDSVKTSAAGTTVNVGDTFGTEIDLAWLYDQSENVNVELGYAMLSPDDALVGRVAGFPVPGGAQDDSITKLYARAKIKWGGEDK